jgi:enoyl-CoA hydratase/carnithine racemase
MAAETPVGSSTGLLVERVGPVGWLTFNRPAAANAMDAAMMDALPAAWADLDGDPDVRVIAVTGAGRAFQTGLDVRQLSRDPAALKAMSRRTRQNDLRLTAVHCGVRKPVITAVNGVCAGGGLHFVVDSDLVIASTSATFLDPHVTLGQASAFEPIGLVRRAAFGPVARMVLTGAHERVTAERARQLGWVGEVVEPELLRGRTQELAEQVASHGDQSQEPRRAALWAALESPSLTEAHRQTRRETPVVVKEGQS